MSSILDLKRKTTPREFANALRGRGGLFWHEEEFWVVTDYRLAEQLLKSQELSADRSSYFASRMRHIPPTAVGNFFSVVQRMMVASDAPSHTARRKLGQSGISDDALDGFEPAVQATIDALMTKVERKALENEGRFEFVAEIAQDLPSTVLAELFGVAHDERQAFYDRANHMTQFFGAGSGCPFAHAAAADQSAAQLRACFADMIQARRSEPKKDFISRLLSSQQALELDDDEVISQAIMMLVAGKVTTTDQIANNLFLLLDERLKDGKTPWSHLAVQPASLASVTEEATRLDPAVNFVFRVAKQDLALGTETIRAGQPVFISIHAVNRDHEIFHDADSFVTDRSKNPHFSYGHGAHYCLGARLARLQMTALFAKLLARFPHLRLDSSEHPVRKHQSAAFSGFESLPLRIS